MMNLAEYRRTAARLSDYLPWAALVAEGVALNKDGSFQRTARFRGPDLDSAVAAELVAVAGRLNNAFRRLGSGWAIFVEAQRHEASTYPSSLFPDAAAALLDAERKADFEEAGAHYISGYYLTVTYLPPAEDAARTETWLYEGRERGGIDPKEVLNTFIDRTDRVLALLDGFMPECAWLDSSETLTYLHSTVSTKRHRVRVPETPIYLDALLADQPLTGGLEPRLGTAHLRILTIVGFPTVTTPGILDDLNRLAFPYRWSTRAILLDKSDATKLLTKIRRQWFAKRKSIAAILKEVMTNEASALVDTDASNKAADADLALQELGADFAGQAYVTATVAVWDDDPRIADEKLRLVEKVIQGRDFTAMTETINAVDAWLGSLPGHVYANVRQPPISTLNLAHMIPLSAVWAGPERDEHFGSPPLLFGKTEGSTPFRFSLHVGDVGHTLVVGPTGAGKSVLLAVMALQFRRYVNSQVFAFDKGSSMLPLTLGLDGDHYQIGGDIGPSAEGEVRALAFCPLAELSTDGDRAWASEWIETLVALQGVTITPDYRNAISRQIGLMAESRGRSLSDFVSGVQMREIKDALHHCTVDGPMGQLLDAEEDGLALGAFQCFEIEELMNMGERNLVPVLTYLFRRIEKRLTGAPSLIILDEAWLMLGHPVFRDKIREWLKVLRKANCAVVLATQSISDAERSGLIDVLKESCPTKICLPNGAAREPGTREFYERIGFNERQIEIVAKALPKREYYVVSPEGRRLFDMALGPVALSFVGASGKEDLKRIRALHSEYGAGWPLHWLQQRGIAHAETLFPTS